MLATAWKFKDLIMNVMKKLHEDTKHFYRKQELLAQHCSIAALHSYNIYKTSLERKKNNLVYALFLATNILQWKK